jgi:hypothetical protein
MKCRRRKFVFWFSRTNPFLSKVYQMHQCTGLDLEDCQESLTAIRQNIGDSCLNGANAELYELILSYRNAGYTPRRAAFRAVQEFYCTMSS